MKLQMLQILQISVECRNMVGRASLHISLFRLKITVGCRLCTCPIIRVCMCMCMCMCMRMCMCMCSLCTLSVQWSVAQSVCVLRALSVHDRVSFSDKG